MTSLHKYVSGKIRESNRVTFLRDLFAMPYTFWFVVYISKLSVEWYLVQISPRGYLFVGMADGQQVAIAMFFGNDLHAYGEP